MSTLKYQPSIHKHLCPHTKDLWEIRWLRRANGKKYISYTVRWKISEWILLKKGWSSWACLLEFNWSVMWNTYIFVGVWMWQETDIEKKRLWKWFVDHEWYRTACHGVVRDIICFNLPFNVVVSYRKGYIKVPVAYLE